MPLQFGYESVDHCSEPAGRRRNWLLGAQAANPRRPHATPVLVVGRSQPYRWGRCVLPDDGSGIGLPYVYPLTDTAVLNPSQNENWGFLHPECHGMNALLFFSWDLAKVIEQQFALHAHTDVNIRVLEAQKAVDRLLKQYVQIQANPQAFEGQSITLKLDQANDAEHPVLSLETSSHLEALIIQAQQMDQASGMPN